MSFFYGHGINIYVLGLEQCGKFMALLTTFQLFG